jgi:hypothetical protein
MLPWLIIEKTTQKKRQKEPGKTSEGTSGCVAPEQVNKWLNSMTAT